MCDVSGVLKKKQNKSVDKQSFIVPRLACTFEELKKISFFGRDLLKLDLRRYFTIFELFLCLEEMKKYCRLLSS